MGVELAFGLRWRTCFRRPVLNCFFILPLSGRIQVECQWYVIPRKLAVYWVIRMISELICVLTCV